MYIFKTKKCLPEGPFGGRQCRLSISVNLRNYSSGKHKILPTEFSKFSCSFTRLPWKPVTENFTLTLKKNEFRVELKRATSFFLGEFMAYFERLFCSDSLCKKVLHILSQTRDLSYKVDRVLPRICITSPFGHLKFVLTT